MHILSFMLTFLVKIRKLKNKNIKQTYKLRKSQTKVSQKINVNQKHKTTTNCTVLKLLLVVIIVSVLAKVSYFPADVPNAHDPVSEEKTLSLALPQKDQVVGQTLK